MDVRILIVDDHPGVRESLQFVFAASGMRQIMEATTCEEAIEIIQNRRSDVVLLDVSLPGESGLDAMRKLIAIEPSLPVLVHSYHDSPRVLSHSFYQGAAGYLVKGFDKNYLIDAVRRVAAGDRLWTAEQMLQIRQADTECLEIQES